MISHGEPDLVAPEKRAQTVDGELALQMGHLLRSALRPRVDRLGRCVHGGFGRRLAATHAPAHARRGLRRPDPGRIVGRLALAEEHPGKRAAERTHDAAHILGVDTGPLARRVARNHGAIDPGRPDQIALREPSVLEGVPESGGKFGCQVGVSHYQLVA